MNEGQTQEWQNTDQTKHGTIKHGKNKSRNDQNTVQRN